MLRARGVMTEELQYVTPYHTVHVAAVIMRDANVGFLPVCDENGIVIGVITDRDLTVRVSAEDLQPSAITVGAVMTREVIGCDVDDDLTRAERLMAQHQLSRLIVWDQNRALMGVISIADIALRDSDHHTAHTLRKIVERERRY